MNAVGIDVSKGKSTVAVMRPFGEVVLSPFEVSHTDKDLSALAEKLKSLPGETRVVMEHTGYYHAPVALALHESGIYVSAVNAMLVHDYGNNSLRRAKTDKKDAVKLANYALDQWLSLPRYHPEEDTRLMLKTCYRQYEQFSKMRTMQKNNLISLLDSTFPDANRLFTSPARTDGSEKWVDFIEQYWHCECVCEMTQKAFAKSYEKWCRKHGYNFSEDKAVDIYASAPATSASCPSVRLPSSSSIRLWPNFRHPPGLWPLSSVKCRIWPPLSPNIRLSWTWAVSAQPLDRRLWLKSEMCAVSPGEKSLSPLQGLTFLHTSLVNLRQRTVISPSVDRQISARTSTR